MPDPAIGTQTKLAFDFEASWNVAKGSPDAKLFPFVTEEVTPAEELLDNPTLRGDFSKSDPVYGSKTAGGSIALVPTARVFGFLARLLAGGSSFTSTGTTNFVHTAKLGLTLPESAVVEADFTIAGAHRYKKSTGVRINSLKLPIAPKGLTQVSLDLLASNTTIGSTPYDSTPTDWRTGSPLDHRKIAATDIEIGGVDATYVKGGDLTINANLDGGDERVGADGGRGSLVPGALSIAGTLNLALDNPGVLTTLSAGLPVSFRVRWAISATEYVEFSVARLFIQKTGPVVRGPGSIAVDAQVQAAFDPTDGCMGKFVIGNDVDGALYV